MEGCDPHSLDGSWRPRDSLTTLVDQDLINQDLINPSCLGPLDDPYLIPCWYMVVISSTQQVAVRKVSKVI